MSSCGNNFNDVTENKPIKFRHFRISAFLNLHFGAVDRRLKFFHTHVTQKPNQ